MKEIKIAQRNNFFSVAIGKIMGIKSNVYYYLTGIIMKSENNIDEFKFFPRTHVSPCLSRILISKCIVVNKKKEIPESYYAGNFLT